MSAKKETEAMTETMKHTGAEMSRLDSSHCSILEIEQHQQERM